jgi:hypothetical protein
MTTPTLSAYNDTVRDTVGNALPGAVVSVLSGQLDTVDTDTQPGSPLAVIWADPYQNSQIPQEEVVLAGTVLVNAGSPDVVLASGNPLSKFLVFNIIVINGVQYTVEDWTDAAHITLATNAISSGTFAYSATIPVTPLLSDGLGNIEFWASGGWYVLQIYDSQMPEQFFQGISVSHV